MMRGVLPPIGNSNRSGTLRVIMAAHTSDGARRSRYPIHFGVDLDKPVRSHLIPAPRPPKPLQDWATLRPCPFDGPVSNLGAVVGATALQDWALLRSCPF